jgi:tetratricopeptide (TPR) repeat protein
VEIKAGGFMDNLIRKSLILFLLILLVGIQPAIGMPQKELENTLIAAFNANKQKQYDISIILSQRVLKEYPENYQALCFLGMAYGGKGDAQKAIDILSKASKYHPKEWSADSFLGDIYMQLESYYIAKQYYEQVVQNTSVPANAKSYFKNQIEICEKKLARNFDGEKPSINVKIPFKSSEWNLKG